MEIQTPVRRRRMHSESFKQAVIDACQVPGASVAGVALIHGVNANQVRRWMRERGVVLPSRSPVAVVDTAPAFVPLAMLPARSETSQDRTLAGGTASVVRGHPRRRSGGDGNRAGAAIHPAIKG